MMKGKKFHIMSVKDMGQVLSGIGVSPVTIQGLRQPSPEVAANVFQHLAEFAYDMDMQRFKTDILHAEGQNGGPELYGEALDGIILFKFARKLASINFLEDFDLKDVWDPQPKRLRMILSAIVNFCRYKEVQMGGITSMKEQVQALDASRLEFVETSNRLDIELNTARTQHNEELPAMRAAECEEQEARLGVERLEKQQQVADRVVEDREAVLKSHRERVAEYQTRIAQLREERDDLQNQVAESPKDLERDIQELHATIRQRKAWIEEKGDEKRARAHRAQVVDRVKGHLEIYLDVLRRGSQDKGRLDAARERSRALREDLSGCSQAREAKIMEHMELEERVRQIQLEIERGNQVHAEREAQLEGRRQKALHQHQDILAKRTEEQRQSHAMQAQRLELEAELARETSAYEAEVTDLLSQQQAALDDVEAYQAGVDAALEAWGGTELPARAEAARQRAHLTGTETRIAKSPSAVPPLRSPAAERRLLFRSPSG
eukprot:TRINITY_DN74693_c0_g1_i1.p1 TRINITY_DN74693_c0_g1~~TRINITY_DN74693_c0_g1_i1.p1  ORF type:complete len:492 (-),score=132.46 TRINITY_DN74693_c0_g1_i1:197-1672(-)